MLMQRGGNRITLEMTKLEAQLLLIAIREGETSLFNSFADDEEAPHAKDYKHKSDMLGNWAASLTDALTPYTRKETQG